MPCRPFEDQRPRIHPHVYIDPSALVIGDVEIGTDSSLWPGVVVRGDIHSIRIGARSNLQDGTVVHVTHASDYNPEGHPAWIGDDVTVGHRALLHGCRVGDLCLIGMGAIVMDGAVLEPGLMLGAGSLVPPGKTLEGGQLWMGSPARRIRPLSSGEREYLEYAAANYVRLKDRFLAQG